MYNPLTIMDPEFDVTPRLRPNKAPLRTKLLPAVVGAAIIALVIIVIVLVAKRRAPGGAKAYTLDTDLSGGKIKPGADPASMRFYVRADDPTHGHVKYDSWDDLVTVQAGKTVISA
jgi:8-oxo-dGTP pyrophosphatase MutT (NUDIX family)